MRADIGERRNIGYARYVGRVGGLAVALGVGLGVATAVGAGVAAAESDSSSASSESSDSAKSDHDSSSKAATKEAAAESDPSDGDDDADAADEPDSDALADEDEDSLEEAADAEKDEDHPSRSSKLQSEDDASTSDDAEAHKPASKSKSVVVEELKDPSPVVARASASHERAPTPLSALAGIFRDIQRTFFNYAPDARSQRVVVALEDSDDVSDPFAFRARDRDEDLLTFGVLGGRGPRHGTITIDQATGAFIYNPDNAFARSGGIDSFTYKVSDASSSPHLPGLVSFLTKPDFGHADIATVTIVVAPVAPKSGIDLSYVDNDIRRADDVFGWLNGKWLRDYEIPDGRGNSVPLVRVQDLVDGQLRDLIEELRDKGAVDGTDAQRIIDLYDSVMDNETLARLGAKPLLAEMEGIDAAADRDALAAVMGVLARTGVGGGFWTWTTGDAKDSSRTRLRLEQGGIGLPDEAYYRDPQYASEVAEYESRIAATFARVYGGTAEDHALAAQQILALETRLAASHWDIVKARDPDLTYNPRTFADLAAQAPGFDWNGWLRATGLTDEQVAKVIVGEPDYLTAFAAAWAEEPLQDWKNWARWQVIQEREKLVDLGDEDAADGESDDEDWQAAVTKVNDLLGHALGKLYVEKYYSAEIKQRAEKIVGDVIEAYRQSISTLEWMSPETRAKALAKLDNIVVKLGAPEQWIDYSGIVMRADDLYGNTLRGTEAAIARSWAGLGQQVDRTEWDSNPQTIHPFYIRETNAFVLPAGVLQAPYLNLDADDAVNYGSIGVVIGHEIGHAFDNQGSKYDADGNLVNWWTPEDRAAFDARTTVLADQYSQYTPRQLPDGPRVNGVLTLGENIADLSGVTMALKAYQMSLGDAPAPVVGGFTGTQRVLLGWVQAWRGKYRDDALRTYLATDPHSPPEFRANGVLRNLDVFYEAFGITESDAMYLSPDQRVRIWY